MINDFLASIRRLEIECTYEILETKVGGKLLEIGAGAGWQAKWLAEHGFKVSAVDLADSQYNQFAAWPVEFYDGHNLPFADSSFDIVYTSSLLEHVKDLSSFEQEIKRVLCDNGLAVHVLPSATWRFWTTITHYVDFIKRHIANPSPISVNELKIYRHGERGNVFTEMFYFSRFWWMQHFANTGWKINKLTGNNLFYTGYSVLDRYLGLTARKTLSTFLGSTCLIYVLSKDSTKTAVEQIVLTAKRP